MSSFSEQVSRLCPNGVKHCPLSEVAHYSKDRIDAIEVDQDTYVGVDNLLSDRKGKVVSSYVPEEGRFIKYNTGNILIGNIRPYLKKIWLADSNGGTNGDVLVIQIDDLSVMSPNFLYYVLSSDSFFAYNTVNAKGAKMPRGDKAAIMKYVVPVPPLSIQNEIVRILDKLTADTAELINALSIEREVRSKQYEYYRNKLLSFDVRGGETNDVLWRTISEVCLGVYSGGTPSASHSEYYNGSIPWLRTQEINFADITETEMSITQEGYDNSSTKWIPENCVIVAMYGATAAKVAINKIPLTTNQACCCLEVDKRVANYRYVYHWISKEYLSLKSLGQGSQNNINAGIIKAYRIPIPIMSEQNRIVSILDQFDAMCKDLTSDIPAEIEARRKQYEYYRDKLLTFKELDV